MEREKINELLRKAEVELSKAQLELARYAEEQMDEDDDCYRDEIFSLTDRVNTLTQEFESLLQKL